jgi:BirA family transcriptional regulator, biotin operon repressor / biotin---[acetyl-CoA-carboxylase] ligase
VSWLDLVHHCDQVRSTMETAREAAEQGAAEGTTIVASSQTAGRGRRGRSWFSPPGAGLWMTTIVRPRLPAGSDLKNLQWCSLSLVAGTAALAAVRAMGAKQAALAWPNDVVVGRKKLAGVLLELLGEPERPTLLMGIGLNIAALSSLDRAGTPLDVASRYIGLNDFRSGESDPFFSPQTALGNVLVALEAWYDVWQRQGLAPVLARWREADALYDQAVEVQTGPVRICGIAKGLDDNGALRVQTYSGALQVSAGEVVRLHSAPGKEDGQKC